MTAVGLLNFASPSGLGKPAADGLRLQTRFYWDAAMFVRNVVSAAAFQQQQQSSVAAQTGGLTEPKFLLAV